MFEDVQTCFKGGVQIPGDAQSHVKSFVPDDGEAVVFFDICLVRNRYLQGFAEEVFVLEAIVDY